VLNALAAIAIAHEVGITDTAIAHALYTFSGIDRRFQMRVFNLPQGEVLFIDDYGHHPREIAAVLQAIRAGWPKRRLVVAFQPHRYTRTHDLFEPFVQVLSTVDVLLLLEVYAAGEAMIPNADSKALCQAIKAQEHITPVLVTHPEHLFSLLPPLLQDQDILLTLGAGSIGTVATALPTRLGQREEKNAHLATG
jgi:UDP-N-acetylmuramate--alanine ligase